MSDTPRITITLRSWEAKHIIEPAGPGGHQGFQRRLLERMRPKDDGAVEVDFDDLQMGELVRHMSYGHDGSRGGFQGRLRKAFAASLARLLGLN